MCKHCWQEANNAYCQDEDMTKHCSINRTGMETMLGMFCLWSRIMNLLSWMCRHAVRKGKHQREASLHAPWRQQSKLVMSQCRYTVLSLVLFKQCYGNIGLVNHYAFVKKQKVGWHWWPAKMMAHVYTKHHWWFLLAQGVVCAEAFFDVNYYMLQ